MILLPNLLPNFFILSLILFLIINKFLDVSTSKMIQIPSGHSHWLSDNKLILSINSNINSIPKPLLLVLKSIFLLAEIFLLIYILSKVIILLFSVSHLLAFSIIASPLFLFIFHSLCISPAIKSE